MYPRSSGETGAPSARLATVRCVVALLLCCLAIVVYVRTVDVTRRVFPGPVWGTAPQIQLSMPKEVAREVAGPGLEGIAPSRPWMPAHPWGNSFEGLVSPRQGECTALVMLFSLPPPDPRGLLHD